MINSVNSLRRSVAPPAPQAAAAPSSPEVVDLSHLQSPVAALLMPFNDLVAAMAAGNGDSVKSAHVHLEGGGQALDYTLSQTGVQGTVNGNAFDLAVTANAADGQVKIAGSTPGGAFDNTVESFPGGFGIKGKTGDVAFEEKLSLNPMGPLSGDIGSIEGHFGADALKENLQTAADGQSLQVTGALGPRNIQETITQGPNGTIQIHGVIGSFTFDETVTRN